MEKEGKQNLASEIRKWMLDTAANVCKDCIDTCCDGIRHRISIEADNEATLELFAENGVPVYRLEELDEHSVKEWIIALKENRTVYTKTGEKIQKPALIEHPDFSYINGEITWLGNNEFSMYVEKYCPLYKNNGCIVHEDSRRPQCCKDYPVFSLFGGLDSEYLANRESIEIIFNDSCKLFNQQKIREDFRRQFPESHVPLCIKNEGRYTICCGNRTLNEMEYERKAC